MEYLNMVMGISTYLFTVTIIAAFRRGEGKERSIDKGGHICEMYLKT